MKYVSTNTELYCCMYKGNTVLKPCLYSYVIDSAGYKQYKRHKQKRIKQWYSVFMRMPTEKLVRRKQ